MTNPFFGALGGGQMPGPIGQFQREFCVLARRHAVDVHFCRLIVVDADVRPVDGQVRYLLKHVLGAGLCHKR